MMYTFHLLLWSHFLLNPRFLLFFHQLIYPLFISFILVIYKLASLQTSKLKLKWIILVFIIKLSYILIFRYNTTLCHLISDGWSSASCLIFGLTETWCETLIPLNSS
jgi:hypothetical protein